MTQCILDSSPPSSPFFLKVGDIVVEYKRRIEIGQSSVNVYHTFK